MDARSAARPLAYWQDGTSTAPVHVTPGGQQLYESEVSRVPLMAMQVYDAGQ